jgi:hypothetical protein
MSPTKKMSPIQYEQTVVVAKEIKAQKYRDGTCAIDWIEWKILSHSWSREALV